MAHAYCPTCADAISWHLVEGLSCSLCKAVDIDLEHVTNIKP